jgi:hypothetical protein
MNRSFSVILFLIILIISGCSSLSKEEETRYRTELANVKNLDRAIEIFKAAEYQSPLEKEARGKIILILHNTELPKAKTADDYFALHDKLITWGLFHIKDDVLVYGILHLESESEIIKIQSISPPYHRVWGVAYNRLKKIKADKIKQ